MPPSVSLTPGFYAMQMEKEERKNSPQHVKKKENT